MSEERYEIIKLLGKGRTGGVYEAEDTRLGRKVAMRRFFSQTELIDVSDYEDDFLNISQSLSALQHPNLLRVFDAGMDEDGAFIITQMMTGASLHDRIKEGPLSSWDVWDLGHQMLDALSTAHAGGFVHGAITPGSILMSPRARGGFLYVILDMGLCRLAPLIQGKDSILSMMADPAILAPELFDGSEATDKSDLYMLGNILYMCLAGGHPFAGKSLEECSKLHRGGLPLLKKFAPEAPDDFVAWIAELCEIDIHDRPHSVVTALKTMPKVEKPASARSTGIHVVPNAATGPVALATPAAQASTLGHPTAGGTLNPVIATGVATSLGQTGVAGMEVGTFEPSKKSNKGIFITIGAIAIVGIILFVMMGDKGKTGEEIAAENKKKKQSSQMGSSNKGNAGQTKRERLKKKRPVSNRSRNKTFAKEEVIALDLQKGSPLRRRWRAIGRKSQKETGNGWSLESAKGGETALAKRITGTDIEDMFKKGWTLKYDVYANKGSHVVGLKIAASENEYWMDTSKSLSLYFGFTNEGGDLSITHQSSGAHIKMENGGKSFIRIEIMGKAGDRSGKFDLYVNGKHVEDFKGKFNQKDSFKEFFENMLFSASGKSGAEWHLKDFSLSVGTE